MRVASIGECMVELTLPREGEGSRVGFAGDTLNAAIYLKRQAPSCMSPTSPPSAPTRCPPA